MRDVLLFVLQVYISYFEVRREIAVISVGEDVFFP